MKKKGKLAATTIAPLHRSLRSIGQNANKCDHHLQLISVRWALHRHYSSAERRFWYCVGFGVVFVILQVFVPFSRYVPILKIATLTLLAYVTSLFVLSVPWKDVIMGTLLPRLSLQREYIVAVVAVFGMTINPYLFFWQTSQEVEEQRATKGKDTLIKAPEHAHAALRRIKMDTYVGMAFSKVVAFCIMLIAVISLNRQGITDIKISAEAAQTLRPIAGDFAFTLFAVGIMGTGMLAILVLAVLAARAMAEVFPWRRGLRLEPQSGKS